MLEPLANSHERETCSEQRKDGYRGSDLGAEEERPHHETKSGEGKKQERLEESPPDLTIVTPPEPAEDRADCREHQTESRQGGEIACMVEIEEVSEAEIARHERPEDGHRAEDPTAPCVLQIREPEERGDHAGEDEPGIFHLSQGLVMV